MDDTDRMRNAGISVDKGSIVPVEIYENTSECERTSCVRITRTVRVEKKMVYWVRQRSEEL